MVNSIGRTDVRGLLAIIGVVGIFVPFVLNAQSGAPQPGVEGTGVFSPLGALGQESAKPRPAQTGPAPRLPDGTVDFTGVWVGGGPVNDIAQGLPKGEKLPLLPASVKLLAISKKRVNLDGSRRPVQGRRDERHEARSGGCRAS